MDAGRDAATTVGLITLPIGVALVVAPATAARLMRFGDHPGRCGLSGLRISRSFQDCSVGRHRWQWMASQSRAQSGHRLLLRAPRATRAGRRGQGRSARHDDRHRRRRSAGSRAAPPPRRRSASVKLTMRPDHEPTIETVAVHGDERRPRPEGSLVFPIYQGTVYAVEPGTDYHDIRYHRLNTTPSQLTCTRSWRRWRAARPRSRPRPGWRRSPPRCSPCCAPATTCWPATPCTAARTTS